MKSSSAPTATVAKGIIFYLDDGTIQSCNPSAARILGYTVEELIGICCFEPPWQMLDEDGSALSPEDYPGITSLKTGKPYNNVVRGFYKQNEELIWLSIDSLPLFQANSNKAYGAVVSFIDIGDRQTTLKPEIKTNSFALNLSTTRSILKSIMADTTDIVVVKDLQGRYIVANQAAANFLGMTIEEILGHNDTDLFAPDLAQSIMNIDRQVITQEIPVSYEEDIFNSEITRSLFTSKYPWRDERGKICGIIGICKDITALKQSQQKLQKKEQLLRLALNSVKAGTWDWSLTTGKVMWSIQNYDLYGLNPKQKQPKYQDWEDCLHPEDRQRVRERMQQVISGQLPEFDDEFRIVHPQQGIRWIWGLANPTLNDDRKIVKLSGINIDITERKQIEEKLRHSEQHLRRVLNSLFTFVGVLDPDGILTQVNRPALEIANLQPEDVLNKPFAECYWWCFSRESQDKLNRAIARAAAGENVRYDVEVRLSETEYILVDFAIVPLFDEDGRVEYLIPSGINITEREASKQTLEQREYELELITEIIPQQIWSAAISGQIDYINQRWQDYTGLDLKQMQRQGWASIVHPDDLSRIADSWIQAVRTGGKFDVEARLRRADGSYHWFLSQARPLQNEQGQIIKWYGTNTNITRIKELEETLRQQTQDLTQANQLKDDFLAIVSHELRTPLNPILGWSQLMAGGRLNPEKMAIGIETIKRNATLQTQLIDDLLDVSRILRGKLELEITLLDLEIIIRSALTTVQLTAEAKSIQIETSFASKVGVSGDARRLQQIVWNLLSNAIKFTPEGGRVAVTLNRLGAQAQILVEDNGQGIEPDFLPYVFERFRQAQSNSTRKYGGLGLGLAIVRHLAELHGGTVTVESPGLDLGATFRVKLPLTNTETTEQTSESLARPVTSNCLNGLRVIVIDDEIDSLNILTLVLQQKKAKVTSVRSANEAIEVFDKFTPDLIISDIGMPEVNGYTLIGQIRALPQGKNVPAIALSAFAGEIDRKLSLDAGYQKHLAKPINVEELLRAIELLLRSNR